MNLLPGWELREAAEGWILSFNGDDAFRVLPVPEHDINHAARLDRMVELLNAERAGRIEVARAGRDARGRRGLEVNR